MSKFSNTKRKSFLAGIPTASIEDKANDIAQRSKFNFSYMDMNQDAGQSIDDWAACGQLPKLIDKLRSYSKEPLRYWQNQRVGKKGNVLEVYGTFPTKSDFEHPRNVPHQALWARFRLEWDVRLIGFILPSEFSNKPQGTTSWNFDCNTFYVVFFDDGHRFFLTGK